MLDLFLAGSVWLGIVAMILIFLKGATRLDDHGDFKDWEKEWEHRDI